MQCQTEFRVESDKGDLALINPLLGIKVDLLGPRALLGVVLEGF